MNLKQFIILAAGVAGLLLVALCPRWWYPSHSLMLQERIVGHRFITNPPKPLSLVRDAGGQRDFYTSQVIAARIDWEDLIARIFLIAVITAWGLWILQRLEQIAYRKKHWLVIVLVTIGLILAANIQTAGKTN
jgi:di/tricarboxylate transporter